MPYASFRTTRGAERYAKDIKGRFPENRVSVVPNESWGWSVLVTMPDGRSALAAKRLRAR